MKVIKNNNRVEEWFNRIESNGFLFLLKNMPFHAEGFNAPSFWGEAVDYL